MEKILPIDIVEIYNKFRVVCILANVFKPTEPFFVEDLYKRFPEIFSKDIEKSENAFVRKMHYSSDSKVIYFEIDEFIDRFSEKENKKKLGFIFHMSRCGSTLFSNLLQCSKESVVYSEPTIINSILDPKKNFSDNQKNILVKAAINLLSDFSKSEDINIFIKFRSWNIWYLENIFYFHNKVPSIFINRNGVEILSSVLKKPSGWLRAKKEYAKYFAKILKTDEADIVNMETNRYILKVLESFLRKIIDLKFKLIYSVDYTNIKDYFFEIATNNFLIKFSDEEMVDVSHKMSQYSKDASLKFEEDASKKSKINNHLSCSIENLSLENIRQQLNFNKFE